MRARACILARSGACTPLEVWRLLWHGRTSAARAKTSSPARARACVLARFGSCARPSSAYLALQLARAC
ncbi:hypothetical protein JCGZ_02397 [Jatropha curcas]|uniref:Uncharacterized protein n=1 Tax=Jatropha curcas TaxID=180498 RepID=A0A067JIX7_JATCU|nr:hypothetical protein JCGZ_02397 [Jatropha curcas]